MRRKGRGLREDALAIWQAGVHAVDSCQLMREHIRVENGTLTLGELRLPLAEVGRLAVVGAGKAGAGMAEGVELALGDRILKEKHVQGWVNVPEDCVRTLRKIHLHGARPAGRNEPTTAGVDGTARILEIVQALSPADVCICLISGGGSALLPAPVDGITLADKQKITTHLSEAGANIEQLNTVRKQLSRVKGGGLARACRAGQLITLVISDVLGDPLDVIASGPTVEDSSRPAEALEILRKFDAAALVPAAVAVLERAVRADRPNRAPQCAVSTFIVGNNAVAVDAAGIEAERRGYSPAMLAARELEGQAEDVGRHLAEMALRMATEPGPDCLITGGEPVVTLAPPEQRGLGGRNQQLVLAALDQLLRLRPDTPNPLDGMALLSGGTDGEDGPTDAAGAVIDTEIIAAMQRAGLTPEPFLRSNNAYRFFEAVSGLLLTGPTHTNVCDLRVVTVARKPAAN